MIDVVLPVLNERAALPWVLERMPEGCSPIVVDNGSSDGSDDIARAMGAEVVYEPRRGFGAACKQGLDYATASVVCFMDCDGSLDPSYLPAVFQPVVDERADLVLGARRPQAGAWPLHARIANRYLARHIARTTGLKVTDVGPMRAAKRSALQSLQVSDLRSGWPLEMVLLARYAGWTVEEVPVPLLKRTGRSKVTGTVRGTVTAIADMGRVLNRAGASAEAP